MEEINTLKENENCSEIEATTASANYNEADLMQQVQHLKAENHKMQNEFNMQRAKLKDLFMQKETEYSKCLNERGALLRELNEMKSQFVVADLKSESEMRLKDIKAQEEILSLQQLVQDTIEESTLCKSELERLKEEHNRIWQENRELREDLQQHESSGLAPQVLSQVKKTIVRKLGGDSSNSILGSSMDGGSFRNKNSEKQYASEDTEFLRSIVVQLQEEMKALKEKLREADEKLQANNSSNSNVLKLDANAVQDDDHLMNKSTSMDMASLTCETCRKYEIKIKELLTRGTEDQEKIATLQKVIEESREDLQKEAALRKDLEDQWQEKRESHKMEVQLLRDQVKLNEQQLLDLQQKFLETKEEVLKELQKLSDKREQVNKHLDMLQADNEFLSGRYLATAEEIENQYINLPNTVEELHELVLRQQNELIQARVGSEFEKQKYVTSMDEVQILRDQLEHINNEQRQYKKNIQKEMKSLQDRIRDHLLTQQNYETAKTALERKEAELNRQVSELRVEIIELQENNEKLEKMNSDCKSKIKILQEDLVTSEQVQKDFVKLSQTLQMSLEKLRRADIEVRWQDDEDIDNCPTCNARFTVTVRKIHCRHCGNIYCDKCLSKTIPSGPRKRIARVCDICHTLLTPNQAPYFSQEPLHSS